MTDTATEATDGPGGVPTGRPLVVAVDGPSGSGKSSVCRRVAAARYIAPVSR